jgi:hypothetical protein
MCVTPGEFLDHEPVMGRVRTSCLLVVGNPMALVRWDFSLMVYEGKFMQVRFLSEFDHLLHRRL